MCRAGVLLLLVPVFLPAASSAQAWVQGVGDAYIKVSHGRTAASEQFRADGSIDDYDPEQPDEKAYFDRSMFLYTEYGVARRVTLVAQLPYRTLHVQSTSGRRSSRSMGDLTLGIRYALSPIEVVARTGRSVAVSGRVIVPLGYARNRAPSVGPGQINTQVGVSIGQSLYPIPAYLQAGVGARFRSELYALSRSVDCDIDALCVEDVRQEYDLEWVFLSEAGITLGHLLFQGIMHGIWSNLPPEADFDARNPIPSRQRLFKTGGGMTVFPRPHIGLSVQVFSTPIGRNTIRSIDVFWGIEVRL